MFWEVSGPQDEAAWEASLFILFHFRVQTTVFFPLLCSMQMLLHGWCMKNPVNPAGKRGNTTLSSFILVAAFVCVQLWANRCVNQRRKIQSFAVMLKKKQREVNP